MPFRFPPLFAPLVAVMAVLSGPVALAQQPTPLEDLLVAARARVETLEEECDKALASAQPLLDNQNAPAEALLRRRDELAGWLPVFPEKFAAAFTSVPSRRVRDRLFLVVEHAKAKEAGPAFRAELDRALKHGKRRLHLVQCLGIVGGRQDAGTLETIAREDKNEQVRASALLATARVDPERGLALARQNLSSGQDTLQIGAVQAVGEVSQSPDQDVPALLRLVREDGSEQVRAEAVRALRRFLEHPDTKEAFEAALAPGRGAPAAAALLVLEEREPPSWGKRLLLEFCRSEDAGRDSRLRERAARRLCALGDPSGARHLLKRDQARADRRSRRADVQMQVGDRYKELGDYRDAIKLYERGLKALNRDESQVQLRVRIARCLALMGQYNRAWAVLRTGGFKTMRAFADDPDFAGMRAESRYARLFER